MVNVIHRLIYARSISGEEYLYGPFEAGELHHGVGDLPAPEGNNALVETIESLLAVDDGKGLAQGRRETRHGLDANLRSRNAYRE